MAELLFTARWGFWVESLQTGSLECSGWGVGVEEGGYPCNGVAWPTFVWGQDSSWFLFQYCCGLIDVENVLCRYVH